MRALAALGVVFAHSFGASGGSFFEGFGNRAIAATGFGALFFFALSGCLLYMPFARRDFGNGGPVALGRYALNRAVRIFPLYYIAVAAVLIVLYDGGTFEQWWKFGLFLENFSTETAGQVHGALWTIVIELHFYVLLPLIAWFISRLSGGSVKRALVVLLGLAVASVLFRIFGVLLEDRPYRDPLRFSLPTTFYFIAVGMLVALVRESWSEGRPAWVRGWLASPDVWLVAAIPFWLIFVWRYSFEPFFAISCFLILGAAVLPLDKSRLIRALDWRPLALLGLTSYSLYIWHVPFLDGVVSRDVPVIDPLIEWLQGAVGSNFIGLLMVTVPLSCAFAALSYALIEAPALRLRKRWGGFRRQSVDAPAAPVEPVAAVAGSQPRS